MKTHSPQSRRASGRPRRIAALVGAALLGQAIGLPGILAVACVTVAALGVTISDRRDSGTMVP